MSASWYYVKDNQQQGPVEEEHLGRLFEDMEVSLESYMWKKGMQNWERLKDIAELQFLQKPVEVEEVVEAEPEHTPDPEPAPTPTHAAAATAPKAEPEAHEEHLTSPSREITETKVTRPYLGPDWESDDIILTIKIGPDRGCPEAEYGPYTIKQLKMLVNQNRINAKTLIFTPGMDTWKFFGDVPLYKKLTGEIAPIIEDTERRHNHRRPFVAKIAIQNNKKVYEGVCRDISVGGLQILVANLPANVGDKINLNVHPTNESSSFTAAGEVVRLLEGGSGVALRFMKLPPEALNAIDRFVERSKG